MTAPDPRLGEIEARVNNHKKSPGGTYGPGSDVAYLLAELRKRDEALARVEELCARAAKRGIESGPPLELTAIRAAVAVATGGEL